MIKFKKIEHNVRDCFPDLINALSMDKEIAVVYLFGSYATGNVSPLSDVDIAILLDKTVAKEDFLDKELDLIGVITSKLKTDEVSFVLLNSAPLVVRYGVLKTAKVLYCRDVGQRMSFEEKTMALYFDFSPFLEQYDRVMYRQILGGRMYGG